LFGKATGKQAAEQVETGLSGTVIKSFTLGLMLTR